LKTRLPLRASRAFTPRGSAVRTRRRLWHLDVGVAAATVALIASGAHPFLSCNGGVLGAHHSRPHPLVRFYLQDLTPQRLRDWLSGSGLSLRNEEGILVLHSERLEPFSVFARLALETLSGNDR
jgi:hypothetical protein